MSHTNSTPNYGLPQWIGSDKPTFLGDMNSAYETIDTALKNNADASTSAVNTANSAATAATTAATNAATAINTANSAATDAAGAVTTATQADSKATQALSAASGAETAAAANTIENLAPAYDATLTYKAGELVSFIDAQGHGRIYKCIVAVSVPEAFNINKWDDVTASEAFQKVRRVFQREFTANDKMRDMFNWMHSVLDNFTTQEIGESEFLIESDTWSENYWCGSVSTRWVRYSRFHVGYQETSFTTYLLDREAGHASDSLNNQTLKTTGTNTWESTNLDTTSAIASVCKIII